ncbi:MAG: hypothetical protein MIO92_08655, partial [Methanosarcinaceae archaeon]|nr:hypothetical protein [Methanosarcinaceae archaeon]
SAELKVKLPERDLDRLTASGSWRAKALKMPPFEAEQAEGQLHVSNGIVAFERIHLQQKGGKAQAEMRFRLDKPHLLDIEAKAQAWPLEIKDYGLHLNADGHTKLRLNVLKRTASGRGNLSVAAQLNGKDFGRFTSDVEVRERTLDLENIKMEAFAGQIEGQAASPLDNWPQSSSELRWQNIDLAMLDNWWPTLDGITGRSSGILTAKATEEQRPLEPLCFQVKVDMSDAMLHGAQLGNCEVVAYAGPKRFLIKQSVLEVAGGVIRSRANFSRHNEELFTHINSDFEHLDLDQVVHIFQPQANHVAGFLTGGGSVVFSRDLRRLTGTADFQLSETDLVNNHVISTLYNSLNLKFDQAQPTGVGRISLRAEGPTLQIPSFYYFNRGAEVRGAGIIKDLNLGLASPLEGYAIGSTRPLKDTHLPGAEELDKLMTSLQKSVASVKIEGTLGKPEVKVVPFPEISSAVRRLLWGQLRE